jgi:hypothetical protein
MKKSAHRAALFRFGLRIVDSPAFLEHGSTERSRFVPIQPVIPTRTMIRGILYEAAQNFEIFKIESKKKKTYSGWCPFLCLSNGSTFMKIQSSRTVPLKQASTLDTHLSRPRPTFSKFVVSECKRLCSLALIPFRTKKQMHTFLSWQGKLRYRYRTHSTPDSNPTPLLECGGGEACSTYAPFQKS